jgi:hypothetical protein
VATLGLKYKVSVSRHDFQINEVNLIFGAVVNNLVEGALVLAPNQDFSLY